MVFEICQDKLKERLFGASSNGGKSCLTPFTMIKDRQPRLVGLKVKYTGYYGILDCSCENNVNIEIIKTS